jgi:hypothetical protein
MASSQFIKEINFDKKVEEATNAFQARYKFRLVIYAL